jgi:hypothetical protein
MMPCRNRYDSKRRWWFVSQERKTKGLLDHHAYGLVCCYSCCEEGKVFLFCYTLSFHHSVLHHPRMQQRFSKATTHTHHLISTTPTTRQWNYRYSFHIHTVHDTWFCSSSCILLQWLRDFASWTSHPILPCPVLSTSKELFLVLHTYASFVLGDLLPALCPPPSRIDFWLFKHAHFAGRSRTNYMYSSSKRTVGTRNKRRTSTAVLCSRSVLFCSILLLCSILYCTTLRATVCEMEDSLIRPKVGTVSSKMLSSSSRHPPFALCWYIYMFLFPMLHRRSIPFFKSPFWNVKVVFQNVGKLPHSCGATATLFLSRGHALGDLHSDTPKDGMWFSPWPSLSVPRYSTYLYMLFWFLLCRLLRFLVRSFSGSFFFCWVSPTHPQNIE